MSEGVEREGAGSAACSEAVDYRWIVELTGRMGVLADARAWPELGLLFADTVELDATVVLGGDPGVVSRSDVVAAWRAPLEGLDSSQHMISNHQVKVDGDEATCIAYFQAVHYLAEARGDQFFIVGGRYDFGLRRQVGAGWQISGLLVTAQWSMGNVGVMRAARERARQR